MSKIWKSISAHFFDVVLAVVLITMLGVSLLTTRRYHPDAPASPVGLNGSMTRGSDTVALTIDRTSSGDEGYKSFPNKTRPAITLKRGEDLNLVGWAVDETTKSAASGLLIDVDGEDRIATSYGDARSDVADALNFPSAVDCGFHATIPEAVLATGSHMISFLVLFNDGHQYARAQVTFTVSVSN